MLYEVSDLDYIFVRGINSKGNWDDLSISEMTDKQFVKWATEKFGIKIIDDENAQGTDWTPEQKVDFINDMSKRLGKPALFMITRKMRKQFDKGDI